MVSAQDDLQKAELVNSSCVTPSQKRRIRRKRLHAIRVSLELPDKINIKLPDLITNNTVPHKPDSEQASRTKRPDLGDEQQHSSDKVNKKKIHLETQANMSSKESAKARDEIVAAREAKKLAKLKAKNKDSVNVEKADAKEKALKDSQTKVDQSQSQSNTSSKCIDEVDRAVVKEPVLDTTKPAEDSNENTKQQILSEKAAKKAAKQAKRKGADGDVAPHQDLTVKDVVETLKDIKNVAKDVQDLTAKVSALNFEAMKPSKTSDIETKVNAPVEATSAKTKTPEEVKSKAELRAERRAKQEAQRAAKQAALDQKPVKPNLKEDVPKKSDVTTSKAESDIVKEKSPKPKSGKTVKPKPTNDNRVNWFQHLYAEHDKDALKKIALNSNLHPAIIKLGVQLASRVIKGSNARCIALLDALKKMLKDYTLPAKTEFARGFEPHLAASLEFLWAMRQPSASQTNAVKCFRHHLTQLPNNIDEFDAKKILQEEIDHYIEDQIDKAGEAISMTVQKKISTGDNILTYGCSSLIERILREAWQAELKFRAVVVGDRVEGGGQDMLRRLAAAGLPCVYVDITAISFVMKTINKVLLGAGALLVNGSVLGAVGTAQVALVARANNVPVLVACETHKFSERVQTDAFVYNELGDPDALIDQSDENSPLKDWRSNPNLTPLNLTYDVTPASLVTAVVTEKAILPCTSAPVVLRTKLTEYGM